MFIVHREYNGKHNMYFRMQESGPHYYDSEYEYFVFVNIVAVNEKRYSKQYIKTN